MGYIDDIRSKIGHDLLIVVGAGIFIYKNGKVLLQKRKDNLCWSITGAGGVEIGESVEEAAKRELFEETGLIANKLELLGVFSGEGMTYTYPNGDKVQIVGIDYTCENFEGEIQLETDETLALKWFGMDEIPQNINPPDRKPFKALVDFVTHIK
jgi:8-oxo-dGTP pyrophosphatase MutT (NUDIX family)